MVGEVPGEVEDRTGRPFVGPAGRLFSELLAQAGLSRERLYITNSVKHFKWKPEGGRRLHARPTTSELNACKPWLEAEILAIRPRVIVCLGAVAAQLVFGREARVGALRGRFHPTPWGSEAYVTMHPSAILRIPDPETRDRAEVAFVEEMRRIDAHARERTRAA
jgi:DNA polymerase